jgi:hypothetical protein
MALAPTPENFRAEFARHCLTRRLVADLIDMHPNMLTGFVTGNRVLRGWAAHNIGIGINLATGLRLIDVDESIGLLPPPPRGRPKGYRQPTTVDPTRRPLRQWRRARRTRRAS